jgi:hypothetical protein
MTLTPAEKKRLDNAEKTIVDLEELIKGAGSKNQLNRLLVLASEEIRRLNDRVTELEEEVETLLNLAKKLQ